MRLIWPLISLALLATVFIPTASASLAPISYGFPTMIQSGTTTAFNRDFGTAWDLESVNFSPFSGFGRPSFGFGSIFSPVVSQSAVQGQLTTQCEFAQSTQFTAFSYPMVDTSLGFAGFGFWP
ncbi:hypothetical protein Mtc_1370 [Methanocella conradii HZ254]|uniref:Uncharacterized protein n=1 Tax=Methanocella conradii (strain DSM 24694 / JCM 17849 / CGMCC 1.5162 / HZ254) TaxID=1041930 RepID=H8IAM7_METCZ|nr:hypothetical protein [Methanocella conradii]AFD00124.1 hypothetical protein Mtc_1370 [Methanocella conradii HZ254]MDI6896056.1 hypothetical protein [Methanocella conradii]